MAKGIDTSTNTQSAASSIRSAGYTFVCRYYNTNNPAKNLTRSEAVALSNAGLYIVAVWENGYPTSSGYFSYNAGKSDGAAAGNYAKNTINQPTGSPIYFAVDYDASTADVQGPILQYFRGIQDGLAAYGYEIGVYGSGLVCSYLRSNLSSVTKTWLSQSTGWAGYSTFTTWNLKQGGAVTVAGLSCDTDQSDGNAGGFQVF